MTLLGKEGIATLWRCRIPMERSGLAAVACRTCHRSPPRRGWLAWRNKWCSLCYRNEGSEITPLREAKIT